MSVIVLSTVIRTCRCTCKFKSVMLALYMHMYDVQMYVSFYVYIQVYFLRPHPQQSEILQWAAEWSRHCAVLFYHTTQAGDSDIRVDFNEGEGLDEL